MRNAFYFAGGGLLGILAAALYGCDHWHWLGNVVGICAGALIIGWRTKGQR